MGSIAFRSQQLQLQQVGKSENVSVTGGVDPAYRSTNKGVVVFCWQRKKKKEISKFLGASFFEKKKDIQVIQSDLFIP